MNLVLLIVLLLLLVGAVGGLPHWPHMVERYPSAGYWPSGGLTLVLVVLLILALMGRI